MIACHLPCANVSGPSVEELVPLTEKLLEVPAELVETALNLKLEGGAVVADDLEGRRCVFRSLGG